MKDIKLTPKSDIEALALDIRLKEVLECDYCQKKDFKIAISQETIYIKCSFCGSWGKIKELK